MVFSSMMLFKRSLGLTSSLFILYVHEHDRLAFAVLTEETALIPGLYLIAFVNFNSFNCDRKGQSYAVQYYLDSVEEYWEGNIHMSEPESVNGNANTAVYFVNQAGGNTRISRTEFVYDERARECKCLLRFELPL